MPDNEFQWDLRDYYTSIDDPKIEQDIKEIQSLADSLISDVKGRIADVHLSPSQLRGYLTSFESIHERSNDLFIYSQLVYYSNTLDERGKAFSNRINTFYNEIQTKILFFDLELNEIEEDNFYDLIKSKELSQYVHYMQYFRNLKQHQLSELEEQIIQMKNITGRDAYFSLFSELTSSFFHEIQVDGDLKTYYSSSLLSLLKHKDRKVRQKSLQMYLEPFKKNELVFTHILNNRIKEWVLESKKRNYKQSIDRRNIENEMDNEIVEVLEQVTSKNCGIVERYYNIKKEILNLPELRIYDMFAPVGESSKNFTFDEALKLILRTAEKFDERFSKIIEEMVKLNHLDISPRKGKHANAFCSHGKRKHYPFVLVNFTNDIGGVWEFAHELGHAFHRYYYQLNQNFLNVGTTIVIMEMAAIFMELLTLNQVLELDLSKEDKITFLCQFIETIFHSTFRQNAFHLFEKRIHKMIEENFLSVKEFNDIFTEEIQRMYGSSIQRIKDDYSHFQFVVEQFYTPFFVYSYNMSYMIVIALFQIYKEKGKEFFNQKYINLLSTGFSKSPAEMLGEFGIDLSDPNFWQKGFDYISEQVSRIKRYKHDGQGGGKMRKEKEGL